MKKKRMRKIKLKKAYIPIYIPVSAAGTMTVIKAKGIELKAVKLIPTNAVKMNATMI